MGQVIIKANIEIVLCVKNGGILLKNTLNSVCRQTYKKWILTCIDDGSDDQTTYNILIKAANNDRRIKVIRNLKSKGLTHNLYAAIKKSNAEFIARIDNGDTWKKNKLAIQFSWMRKNKKIIVLGTQCDYVSGDQSFIGKSWFQEDDNSIRQSFINKKGIFEHSSIIFRRVINYRKAFLYSQDLDLYLRASNKGLLECHPDSLTICRVGNLGITNEKKPLQLYYHNLAYKTHFQKYKISQKDIKSKLNPIESVCWNLAKPFWYNYVLHRTSKNKVLAWVS